MQSPVVCPAPPHLWRFLVIAEKYLNFRHLKILKPTLCTLCCWWRLACPGTATTGGPLRRNSCMAAAKRYLHQKIFQLIHLRLEIFRKTNIFATFRRMCSRYLCKNMWMNVLTMPSSLRVPLSIASSLNCIWRSWLEPSGSCKKEIFDKWKENAERSHQSLVEWSPWSLQLPSELWLAHHPAIEDIISCRISDLSSS